MRGLMSKVIVLAEGLYSSAAIIVGIYYRIRWLRIFGLIGLGVTILKVVAIDMTGLDRIFRVLSFFVVGGLLIAVGFLYQKRRDQLSAFFADDEKKPSEGPK